MGKSLLALLALLFLSCNNAPPCNIPKNAIVRFVSAGDTFNIFGNKLRFSHSSGDTAWFEYFSGTGGLRGSNDLPYEFPPDTMINWSVVYLGKNSAGVMYWKKLVYNPGF